MLRARLHRARRRRACAGTETDGLDDPFLRAFTFSVGVFTTTGTGPMHAYGPTANWLVNLESFVGPITLVVAFGLLIARLTRPRMRLGFSESAIIAPYEGGRGLMFRIVNLQPGELSDVQARVNLDWYEETSTASRERNFHELALERDSVEFFTLHWTVVHPITADSPLAGVTPESLAASQAEFLIFITALEETFSTRVSTRDVVRVGRGSLGREVREHLRERSRRRDRDRRRAAESHRAARRRRRDAQSPAPCHPSERGALRARRPSLRSHQAAQRASPAPARTASRSSSCSRRAQHLVRDRVLRRAAESSIRRSAPIIASRRRRRPS